MDGPSSMRANYGAAQHRDAVRYLLSTSLKGTPAVPKDLNKKAKAGFIEISNIYFAHAFSNALSMVSGQEYKPLDLIGYHALMDNNPDFIIKGTYCTPALVIMPRIGAYPKIWRALREQIKEDNIWNVDLDKPIVVNGSMRVVKDKMFENKLNLLFSKESDVKNADILNFEGGYYSTKQKSIQECGLPNHLVRHGPFMFVSNMNSGLGAIYAQEQLLEVVPNLESDRNYTGRTYVVTKSIDEVIKK